MDSDRITKIAPPPELSHLIGAFLDTMSQDSLVTIVLITDISDRYLPVFASNIKGDARVKREMLEMWLESFKESESKDSIISVNLPSVQ